MRNILFDKLVSVLVEIAEDLVFVLPGIGMSLDADERWLEALDIEARQGGGFGALDIEIQEVDPFDAVVVESLAEGDCRYFDRPQFRPSPFSRLSFAER